MLQIARSVLAGLALCVLASGCSDGGADRKPTHPVSGTVTLAGSPVADASVTFSPTGQGQPVATGRTNSEGKYTLTTYEGGDGAVAGDYVALVTKSSASTTNDPQAVHEAYTSGKAPASGHSGRGGSGGSDSGTALPDKYSNASTSPLTVTVKAEDNTIDLQLEP